MVHCRLHSSLLPLSGAETKSNADGLIHLTGNGPILSPFRSKTFSRSLYKWIRYATGIFGAHGTSSLNKTQPLLSPTMPGITDDERLRMFPLDPMLTNARITMFTGQSTRRAISGMM